MLISQQLSVSDKQLVELRSLADRVSVLERGTDSAPDHLEQRATLGPGYLLARRSIRLSPIHGSCDDDLWEGVGGFLHDTLTIREDDVGQEDIKQIDQAIDGRHLAERKEVIVRFYERQKRDLVVSSSPAFSNKFD